MPFTNLIPSRNLQIFSYEDIDHFRSGIRDTNVDIVPLANFNGDLGQAVLTLPGCTVYLLRTFPRIVRSAIGGGGTFFLFSLRDAPAVIFNGKEAVPSSFTFARGPAEYRAVEREPGYYAAIAFSSRMEAKDGSMGFDFAGTYGKIVPQKLIEYTFGGRATQVEFTEGPQGVNVRVTFDAEATHSEEQQRGGWQAILNNFARHVETLQRAA